MRTKTLIIAAAVMQLLGPRPAFVRTVHAADPTGVTAIEEVVMYGIDQETYELLRYEFTSDTFTRIGVVTDQNGEEVKDAEGLAFIPSGPHKAMYATANYHGLQHTHLAKINPMDATATIMNMGDWDVVGLVAAKNAFGEWMLLAVSKPEDTGDGENALKAIDPATGSVTILHYLSRGYEGLTLDPDGTLLAVYNRRLYTIDPVAGTETFIGQGNFDDLEALEYAFGDYTPAISCAEAPASWTDKGVLFAFSDPDDALVIVNPANGATVEYNCTFKTVDCEGLVFTTQLRDSYGTIVVDACD